MATFQELEQVFDPNKPTSEFEDLLGQGPIMPGAKAWPLWVSAQSYFLRKGKTPSQYQLTPEEEERAFTTLGKSPQLFDELIKAIQQKEMGGTYGANWKEKAQAQMTPEQKAAVSAGVPTKVDPLTGMPEGTPKPGQVPVSVGQTGTSIGQNGTSIEQKVQDVAKQVADLTQRVKTEGIAPAPAQPASAGGGTTPSQNAPTGPTVGQIGGVGSQTGTTPNANLGASNEDLYSKYGIQDLVTKAYSAPEKTYAQVLKEVLTNSDYTDTLAKTTKLASDIRAREEERDRQIALEKDNPFYSESALQRKMTQIQDEAGKALTPLQNEYARLTGLVSDMRQSAEEAAGMAIKEAGNEQELNQEKLKLYLDRIDQSVKQSSDEKAAKKEEIEMTKPFEEGGYLWTYNPNTMSYEKGEKTKTETGTDLAGGLTASQMNSTINSIAGAFDNEPIVKEYNTINAQYQFLKTAGITPTDDISRVYVFAKVMDPNSVVREGEYKTVQDYSTALLQRFGIKTKRVFDNVGFLTNEARKFMEDTIKRRLDISQAQYDQVAKEYQRQIDQVKSGKTRQITDYSGAFPQSNVDDINSKVISDIFNPLSKYWTNDK